MSQPTLIPIPSPTVALYEDRPATTLKGTLGLIEKVARTCETKSQVMWSMIITYSQDTKPGESEWMKILQA